MFRLRRIFLQDCRRKNVGVVGKGIQGNALRRGFFVLQDWRNRQAKMCYYE